MEHKKEAKEEEHETNDKPTQEDSGEEAKPNDRSPQENDETHEESEKALSKVKELDKGKTMEPLQAEEIQEKIPDKPKSGDREQKGGEKDQEQDAEPEGGPKADRYGRELDKLKKRYKMKRAELKKVMAKIDKLEQY